MRSLRWWDVAVVGMTVILAAIAVGTGSDSRETVGGLASAGALAVVWFALARRALRRPSTSAILVVAVIVICAVGTAFLPAFATVQCIAFPLVWTFVRGTRRAIAANVVLGVGVGIGTWLSTGSLLQAFAVQGVSIALSISLGLWITSIAQQSEERQRLLDELRTAQEKLSALDRDAGVASERERLAREIHDTIAQDLTGLVMLAQRAQRELSSGVPAAETLGMLEVSARTALAETRALVASGTPVALNGGISDALDRLGERFARETGLTVTVAADGLPELDRDTEVVLLRCAQEGLANVRKHSGGRTSTVTAWADNGSVALRVTDDGTGFDPDAATDGFGLDGMRSRLALVGGALDISTSPAGTVLTATLPLRVSA
ncbi:sensor histidine kinase [Salinibacterium sp. G-O1]|uniref:sensor histidine kinase n=1 Tax=Salinibacterium sp. G-O1 TaxID=3046208 RepID=UPI0024BA5493|nr:sensor histidine kinase [Salinibacterium sp. G-O1]MDJ0336461.1 sensor histidine kinase [Salinibacterium sp. G-O1]